MSEVGLVPPIRIERTTNGKKEPNHRQLIPHKKPQTRMLLKWEQMGLACPDPVAALVLTVRPWRNIVPRNHEQSNEKGLYDG